MGNCIGGCSAAKRVTGSYFYAHKYRRHCHCTDIKPNRGKIVSYSSKKVYLHTSLQTCHAFLCPKHVSLVASLLTLDSAALI